ncbi:UDP-N-acetylglucosamine:LPS N-acetylglucosamine transferase [Pseudomonas pohangensis]|uniref:UDP-N-acetylglucosamine:LPS N-acetylglucosamine transferase n=1 Tax=Pseudomonas pohangensis TaxID=364197 RepID=A0A1H2H161_9PSED|nr:UDP-N-acetylglucosamine:LPS N-acetylglucosamine transferase [Pseudomonas pohangensis]
MFLPINGAGLGHVSRALAVAKALRKQQPEARIVFLTTSIAVHLVYREGFVCHHVPPAALLGAGVGTVSWNRLFYRCVSDALTTHRPGTLVFDGSAPYLGLQRAIRRYRSLRYVWIKRGLYKASIDQRLMNKNVAMFDAVIAPSEFGVPALQRQPDERISMVAPIIGMDRQDLLSPSEVCARLRIDPGRPRVYVQLGAGNINGIAGVQAHVVRILRQQGYQVVVGQSPIALKPESSDEADREIVDYPNSRYFAGFDFAVLAAGYNSVCEAISLNLPAIFLPNQATQADDQTLRATLASEMGPCEVVAEFSEAVFLGAISKLLPRIKSGETFPLHESNGANEAAKLVSN